ncbi:MAG: histidine phosphatase family protein [Fibrobacteraceae bacterium]|nr:histidine phosphatase family protein [Fibrobacteraceae bacterium]
MRFLKCAFVVSVAAFFACCSDDSDSSPAEPTDIPASSDATAEMGSSDAPGIESSATIPLSSASVPEDTSANLIQSSASEIPVENPVVGLDVSGFATDSSGFYDLSTIYKALLPTDKVVFLIRHAERDRNSADLSVPLTVEGEAAAVALGQKLVSEEEFTLASSGVSRATVTATKIAEGRGQAATTESVLTYDTLGGNWFLLNPDTYSSAASPLGGGFDVMTEWAYTGANDTMFYNIEERANEFMNNFLIPHIGGWNRVTVAITHDYLIMTLTVFYTNRTVNLKSFENGRWINYMTGLAIIQHADGSIQYVPVTGMDTGYMY